MHFTKTLVLLASLVEIAGCSTLPPKFVSAGHHPVIDRDGTINILADVCIKYDTLVDADDHFLGVDSRTIAVDLLKNATDYLSNNGIQVHSAQAPFVCGATHNEDNEPERFASLADSPIVLTRQPFDVSNEVNGDQNYVEALRIVSSYVFDHALNANGIEKTTNIFSGPTPYIANTAEFKAAAQTIATQIGQSNLLYIGVTGEKQSPGKAMLKAVAATAASAALAAVQARSIQQQSGTIITPKGEVVKPPVVVQYPVASPVSGVVAKQVVVGLIDLQSKELVWTSSIDAQLFSSPDSLNQLLFDVSHRHGNQWTPPGAPYIKNEKTSSNESR